MSRDLMSYELSKGSVVLLKHHVYGVLVRLNDSHPVITYIKKRLAEKTNLELSVKHRCELLMQSKKYDNLDRPVILALLALFQTANPVITIHRLIETINVIELVELESGKLASTRIAAILSKLGFTSKIEAVRKSNGRRTTEVRYYIDVENVLDYLNSQLDIAHKYQELIDSDSIIKAALTRYDCVQTINIGDRFEYITLDTFVTMCHVESLRNDSVVTAFLLEFMSVTMSQIFNYSLGYYVYVMLTDNGEYMKVGISNNPSKRLSSIQSSMPMRVNLVQQIPCDLNTARQLEKLIHNRLDDFQLSGEWFDGVAYQMVDWTSLIDTKSI